MLEPENVQTPVPLSVTAVIAVPVPLLMLPLITLPVAVPVRIKVLVPLAFGLMTLPTVKFAVEGDKVSPALTTGARLKFGMFRL